MLTQKTVYVLDTNVLLTNAKCLFHYENNNVIIPIYVLEELDKFKKESGELGVNARKIIRQLDELREKGSLETGIQLDNGTMLQVTYKVMDIPTTIGILNTQDEKIIATAYLLKNKNIPVTLVTNDINVRIRADSLGIKAQGYETPKETQTDKTREIEIGQLELDLFYSNGSMELEDEHLMHNQYLILKSSSNHKATGLAKYDKIAKQCKLIKNYSKTGVFGIRAKSHEQCFALDALLDDNIKLVTLAGLAGCGKSLLATACGLEKVVEQRIYDKVTLCRPISQIGKDIGALPGELDVKIYPYMRALYDILEQLLNINNANARKSGRSYRELIELGYVKVEPIQYLRGVTLPNQWIIIDDAQNISKADIKSIITRIGNGSKVIVTGDNFQVDDVKLNSENNGFNHLVSSFRDQPIAAHITFSKSERSDLAALAANLL